MEPREVDWIKRLIEFGADGWTVMARFQPEGTTFDAWWRGGDALVCINDSAPTGFSDLLQVISPHDLSQIRAPSSVALVQERPQIHRILIKRRGQGTPSIAHLRSNIG